MKSLLVVTLLLCLASTEALAKKKADVSGLFTDPPTLVRVPSRGPNWIKDLKDNFAWEHAERITKMADEGEMAYEAADGCLDLDELDWNNEYDYELDYEEDAVKSKASWDRYEAGEIKSRPSTIAYALQPKITFSYRSDEGKHLGECVLELNDVWEYYDNNKQNAVLLGISRGDSDDDIEFEPYEE